MKGDSTRYAKSGWGAKESEALFEAARIAAKEGKSIKSVFEAIAKLTGRKPNSIRNYYYTKLKENGGEGKTTFVPFCEEEVHELVLTMLTEQAKGKSVRSIAMDMGGGNKKNMLRYQNKYRSILKGDPNYVKQVMDELTKKGIKTVDPFSLKRMRLTKMKKDISEVISELAGNLPKVGQEGEMVINCLNNLVKKAVDRDFVSKEQILEEVSAEYEEQIREFNRKIETYKVELARQVALNSELERRIESLENLNRSFSKLSGMERISGLSDYVNALTKCLNG